MNSLTDAGAPADTPSYTLGQVQSGPACCAPVPHLAVRGLSVAYHDHPVLEDVSLDIFEGCITALIGPSGYGKTSFLTALNRLSDLVPGAQVSGSVCLGETDLADPALDVRALRQRVGMIFQKPNPFPLSIRRNLEPPLREHGVRRRAELDERVKTALVDVGLWAEVNDRLDQPALNLSGGQQQRLCIARALVLRPEVLLMDEPCSALDPISSAVVEDLIVRLRMLAVIGGTGLYDLAAMQVEQRIEGDTPFGAPSGTVVRDRIGERPVLFLARHRAGHRLLPHEVNYRANIFALKHVGATMVLGFSAVGSLAEHIAPGDLAMPEQYFDWTRGVRERTFFGHGVAAHVSTANPVSAALVDAAAASAQSLGITLHRGLTFACVEGPRLGTRAESQFLRQVGCHLVGMTNVPEVFLAREAQMAYATVGIVTDYDCWLEDPARHVSVAGIFELYGRSLATARRLLDHWLAQPVPTPELAIRTALQSAMLTPDAALTPAQLIWLSVLRQ